MIKRIGEQILRPLRTCEPSEIFRYDRKFPNTYDFRFDRYSKFEMSREEPAEASLDTVDFSNGLYYRGISKHGGIERRDSNATDEEERERSVGISNRIRSLNVDS